jgi:beta-phosphoglucomutase-like phosphatase (HAD superfamily)
MLKLPEGITALLFDLDGVITQTAKLHAAAWKEMFDAFLRERSEQTGEPFEEFTPSDYDRYVDGRPRYDGVRTFLVARGIEPDDELVRRLGDRKNELVQTLIRERGVEVYEGSLEFVREAQREGLRRAVVSSSANTQEVLQSVGIEDLFEAVVDGLVAQREGLPGKPAPDTFLAGLALSAQSLPRRWFSRTPSPASRRAGPAASAGWWASTGSGSGTPSPSVEPTWWWTT